MLNTKSLYASTLVLASLAGFSSGWASRPPEKVVLTDEDGYLYTYEQAYEMTDADRAEARRIIRDFLAETSQLRKDFDHRFGDQVDALADKYDERIKALLPREKMRR